MHTTCTLADTHTHTHTAMGLRKKVFEKRMAFKEDLKNKTT